MNKRISILILILISFGDVYSQDLSDKNLTDFFNQTFKDYFGQRDSLKKESQEYYILRDSVTTDIVTEYENFKFHLIDNTESYPLIKKGKISALFWAKYKQISIDTGDIVIGGWSVNFERVFRIQKVEGKRRVILRNYNFAAWCGGTLGYIPEGRLVYDYELGDWKYLTQKSVIDEKMARYRN
jgi:hypothetical protein